MCLAGLSLAIDLSIATYRNRMSPSTSQFLTDGKDPPGNTNISSPVDSPRPPYTSLQPSQLGTQASTAPRPMFSPFFTLVDDTTKSSTHHPVNIRYIFSDDDQDLTAAYLAAISASASSPSSSDVTTQSVSSSITSSREQISKQQRLSGRAPKEPEHRTILIDLDETGTSVTAAHSLSPSWQILSTSLTQAPTWEASPATDDDATSARFMLRIEGTQSTDARKPGRVEGRTKDDGRDVRPEDFQSLMEDFDRKMKLLRAVVDSGDAILGVGEQEETGQGTGQEGRREVDGEAEKDRAVE